MPFLTAAQLTTHIYPGVSEVISQGDTTILENAISAAIGEAKGYLSRYRVAQIFDNEDADDTWVADPVLAMYVKHMAKWHFILLGNANIDYVDTETRYDQAIKWLMNIQSGKIVPINWPPAVEEGTDTFFHVASNRKRNNHF
jgi:phage gp36-like protein